MLASVFAAGVTVGGSKEVAQPSGESSTDHVKYTITEESKDGGSTLRTIPENEPSNALGNSGTSISPASDRRSRNISFSVSFEEPQLKVDNGYDLIEMAGCGSFASSPGAPTVPKKTVTILLPPEGDVSSIMVTPGGSRQIKRDVYLYPGQRPVPISDESEPEFTPPDPEFYESSDPYPSELLESQSPSIQSTSMRPKLYQLDFVTSYRGYQIAVLTLYPVTYTPASRRAMFYPQLNVEVELGEAADTLAFRPTTDVTEWVESNVVNPELMSLYEFSSESTTNLTRTMSLSGAGGDDAEYLIITRPMFVDDLQPLVDLKSERMSVKVVTIENDGGTIKFKVGDDWKTYPGRDVPEKIRNCIIDYYTNEHTQWVLLVGDADSDDTVFDLDEVPSYELDKPWEVPIRYVVGYEQRACWVPTDYYYAGLAGTWDGNGDNLFGEYGEADLFADVYVGRIPARDQERLSNIVSKTVAYESNLPMTFSENVLLFGAKGLNSTNILKVYIKKYLPDQVGVHEYYEADGNLSFGAFIDAVNEYDPVLINACSHGTVFELQCTEGGGAYVDCSTPDGLWNKGFLMYSVACYTIGFDYVEDLGEELTVGEALLYKLNHSGAVGCIGGTRLLYESGIAGLDYKFFENFFLGVEHHQGAALYKSKISFIQSGDMGNDCNRQNLYTILLLGDPELKIIDPPYGATISISPDHPPLDYSVTVRNIGGLQDNYILTASDTAGWDLTFDNPVLNLSSGEECTTTLRAAISESDESRTNVITVTVISQADPSVSDSASCTVTRSVYINGNENFTKANGVNGGGSGTVDDPYIIENWVISASTDTGIRIMNTTAHFIIRNCLVENGRNALKDGIRLENVVNGKVDNIVVKTNRIGIYAKNLANTILIHNICENNEWEGIELWDFSNNIFDNNICKNNEYVGTVLYYSDNNTLTNNTFSNNMEGINLCDSDNNIIHHNSLSNNPRGNAYDSGTNCWDNGSEGNGWSDWQPPEHPDADEDGIVDEPRPIWGGNQDRYPLVMFRIITTVEELQAMNANLGAYYALGNDIDASATQWWNWEGYYYAGFEPIGEYWQNPFTGSFDGRGHVISNLYMRTETDSGAGLFGCTSGAVVKNLGLEDVSMSIPPYTQPQSSKYWGAIVGINNNGRIDKCYSTGSVCGWSGSAQYVGGLVGRNASEGIISNCYSTVSVYGASYYPSYVGGLVGFFDWDEGPASGRIINCYSTGPVVNGSYVGGLIGGNPGGVVSNCFWDIETSGRVTSDGGTGKSTSEMKDVATFTYEWNEETEEGSVGLDKAWDFVGNPYNDTGNEDIWNINPAINDGYPFLTAFPEKMSVSLTPTEDGFVFYDDEPPAGYGRYNTTDEITFGKDPGSRTYRGYVEWNISAIPNNATITKVVLKYHGALNQGTDARIADLLGVRPSESSNELLFSAIAQDDYIFVEGGFPEIGANEEVDLGSLGVEILQIYLDDQCGWFAVGLMAVSESYPPDTRSEIYSSDYGGATPKPTLYVEYLPHDRIYIVGNEDFTAVNGVTGGSGTESDPYIIENRVISASSANGIDIRDTTAYFVVRNCVVANGGDTYNGICLNNVVNGRVENCTCKNNATGIYLSSSSYNIVRNNICESNGGAGLPVSSYPIIAVGNAAVVINGTYAADYWKGCYAAVNGQVRRITMSYDTGGGGTYLAVDAWWNPKPTPGANVSLWGKAQIMQLGNNAEGIWLEGSSYNNLDNNTCEGNWDCGIYLDSSDNNTITNNTCSNNNYNIALVSSSGCNIGNNTCGYNDRYVDAQYGIYLGSSDNNTLTGNTVEARYVEMVACICLEESDYNILGNNIHLLGESKYGVRLKSSGYNLLENNTVEGGWYACIYLDSSSNNTLNNNTAYTGAGECCPIFLLNSDYNNLTNNIARGSDSGGIQLRYSDYNVLDGNITDGAESITLLGSNYNTVRNNSVTNVWISIKLVASNNNTIDNNTCSNSDTGIQLSNSSNNNLIFHNNIINNTTQARDDGSNYWDDGYPSGGNYWSDYTGADDYQGESQDIPGSDGIGDTPYYISGSSNKDLYPLVNWSPPD
jgi:parallel beta-helix repeat protein